MGDLVNSAYHSLLTYMNEQWEYYEQFFFVICSLAWFVLNGLWKPYFVGLRLHHCYC